MTDKKLKILYLITKSNFGGAQKYVYDLATSLPKDRFDVVVGFGEGKTLEEKLERAGIRTVRIQSLVRNINIVGEFKVFWELIKIYRAEKPDIIHLNSSKIGGLGGLAGRLFGHSKIIFTGHAWAFNEERSSISKIIIGFLHWITVALCHMTIAVSEKTARQIKAFPGISKKIAVIHNGIEKDTFLSKEDARAFLVSQNPDLKKASEKHPDAIWIGTTSELHKVKGLDYMLAGFSLIRKKFPEIFFVILGEGDERKNLEKIIATDAPDNAFLLGFIKDGKQYIKAFDIFTLTSRSEGFPYSILEAGQASLPTIASHVGGIPEIIDDMHSGILVNSYHPAEIERAITYLLENPEKREVFGKNLSQKVSTSFSVENMVRKTIDLYLTVLQ